MTKHPRNDQFAAQEQLYHLQEYQSRRFRETYADIVQEKQYRNLGEFFFEEIYGPQEFGFRNESIKSLHQHLSGILHGDIIDTIGKVVELNDLSEHLDRRMAEEMAKRGLNHSLSPADYADIYRSLDNYDERSRQINLLVGTVRGVYRLSQMRMIEWSLKIVGGAARLAGYGRIMDFLTRGYHAFHKVENIERFLQTVHERETEINDRLFGRLETGERAES